MSERTPFVCLDCHYRVSSTAYRATCPECGGALGPAVGTGATNDRARSGQH